MTTTIHTTPSAAANPDPHRTRRGTAPTSCWCWSASQPWWLWACSCTAAGCSTPFTRVSSST